MKNSYTPEEVSEIEEKAYRFGVAVGEHTERSSIMELILQLEESSIGTESLGCLVWTRNLLKQIEEK
jgi:hypothetical protein